MNSLSLFNPSFADSIIDVLDKNFPGNFGVFAPIKHGAYGMPTVDIRESDSAYIMEADLPGYTENDVEINLKDGVMTVSSSHDEEKDEVKKEDDANYILKERSSKYFIRRFTLPEDINQDEVSADFENGVLTINIPKKADIQPRRIEIKRK